MEDLFETMLQLNQVQEGRRPRGRQRESKLEASALIEALGGEYLPGNRYTREDSAWLDLDHAIAARNMRSAVDELDYDDFRHRGNRGSEERNEDTSPGDEETSRDDDF